MQVMERELSGVTQLEIDEHKRTIASHPVVMQERNVH
jgi:hypothetical protein